MNEKSLLASVVVLVLLLLSASEAKAWEVYVNNRPFKGMTAGFTIKPPMITYPGGGVRDVETLSRRMAEDMAGWTRSSAGIAPPVSKTLSSAYK
jgi:hypothetical protein